MLDSRNRLLSHVSDPNQSPSSRKKKSFKETNWRWLLLFLACYYLMGNNFCFDNPAPIEKTLEKDLNITTTQYTLLYSVYSYPNMVLPIFGGIFLDIIGLRVGLILFCVIIAFGQAVFMIGGYYKSLGIMIAGRVLFGLGGESMTVGQSAIISKWFRGKELAMALGVDASFARIGAVINGAVLPKIYNMRQTEYLGHALFVGLAICVSSIVCSFFLVWLDRKSDMVDKVQNERFLTEEDKFKLKDLKTFKLSLWLICASCVIIYTTVFPFMELVTEMMEEKYKISEDLSGTLFGVPYIISALTSPFLGYFIDKVGRRVLMVILATLFLLAAHILNMLLPECDSACYVTLVPLVFVGVGYSLYAAALWGSIPYVVEAKTIATAFGLCTAIQNTGMAVAPLIGGIIKDATKEYVHGYYWLSFFWICMDCVGLLLNVWLYYEDIKHNNGTLNKVHKGEELIEDLMTSPKMERKRQIEQNPGQVSDNAKEFLLNRNQRNALKKSMAAADVKR